MMFLLLSVVFVSIAYIYHLKLKQMHKQLENIPGPPFLPLIGNALEFGTNKTDLLMNMKRIAKQYGPVVRLCIGPQVCILLSEPKYIAQVMSSSESADKPDFYKFFEAVAGDGLPMSTGKKWRRHRRIIEPMFSSKQLAEYMAVFNANSDKLVEQLKPMSNCEKTDATDYVYQCAMKTIFNTAINVDAEYNDEYHKACDWAFFLPLKRYFSFFKRPDFIYKFTSDYKLLQKYKAIIQDYTETLIAQRKRDLSKDNHGTSRSLFLDKLLKLSGDDALTDEEIRDEVKSMIYAGSDTIGGAMSFGIFELAKHPHVQKKILDETNHVLGNDKSADVSFEDAQCLWYTECVYKEILRLYSPASFIIRKFQSETKFGDFTIPGGAYVIIFIAQVHMSENEFPNPEIFDPDRHLPENTAGRHPYAFMPFGGGPRICIGQKYSILEAKVMLSKIVRNFELKAIEPEHKLVLWMPGTLKSASGLPVRLKIREDL